MDRNYESVTHDAEQRGSNERLLHSERRAEQTAESPKTREAWAAEAERRADAIDSGAMQTVDAFAALGDLHQLILKKSKHK